jgi:membrane-bound serine protease (ClpP class)
VDGRQVELHSGETATLRTADATQVSVRRNLGERLLDILADPNIAFLLLSLGALAIFFELSSPGTILPGVFGVIALILGFFALSVIPFNWAGAALILAAFVFLFLEIFVPSGGVLAIGGVISLVLGGLLLTSGNPSDFQVDRRLIYGLSTAIGLFFFFAIMGIIRARRLSPTMGMEVMIGQEAVVRSPLNPSGFVLFEGEHWSAEAEEGQAKPGERVVITGVEGLKLKVRRQKEDREERSQP